ncbi:MAG: DUF401 family protein [Selenomonadaceae bacterium]|nr:DUF401 family protein [Selenomonadaceae bacterium]
MFITNIFLQLIITVSIILILMSRKYYMGLCMLAGGIVLWLMRSGDPFLLATSFVSMLHQTRTYDLIISLYLIMCMEILLRSSGTLANMVNALKKAFSSDKAIIAIMPFFLGVLPSVGGARFSCPIVEESSRQYNASQEDKAAINYWFRHPCELFNPIVPGMIMACSISGVAYSEFLKGTFWICIVWLILGWILLIQPLKKIDTAESVEDKAADTSELEAKTSLVDVFLAIMPIFITFLLVVFLNLNASIAMILSTSLLYIILLLRKAEISLKDAILGAIDKKMFINIGFILYFVQILEDTGALSDVVAAFQAAPLPTPVIIAGITFVVAILTGMSQAYIAIVMPISAALSQSGDMLLLIITMVFGLAGLMLTPIHVCFTVTTDYFNASFFKVLYKIMLMIGIILAIFSGYQYWIA